MPTDTPKRVKKRLRCGVCNTKSREDRFLLHFEVHKEGGWHQAFTPLADDDLSVAELLNVVEREEPLLKQGRNFATINQEAKHKLSARYAIEHITNERILFFAGERTQNFFMIQCLPMIVAINEQRLAEFARVWWSNHQRFGCSGQLCKLTQEHRGYQVHQ